MFQTFNWSISVILGVTVSQFGRVYSQMMTRPGTIIKVLKNDLTILLSTTVIGGCDWKNGNKITIRSTFVKYSQAHGLNSQFRVNGEVILPVVIFHSVTSIKKEKKAKRINWLLCLIQMTNGSTILNTDWQLQKRRILLSVWCRKTLILARDL